MPPVDSLAVTWESPRFDDFPGGAARKALRNDPDAQQGASINGLLPQWVSPYTEWHTFSEEVYILEGTIDTTFGRMTKGAYLAHPRKTCTARCIRSTGACSSSSCGGP